MKMPSWKSWRRHWAEENTDRQKYMPIMQKEVHFLRGSSRQMWKQRHHSTVINDQSPIEETTQIAAMPVNFSQSGHLWLSHSRIAIRPKNKVYITPCLGKRRVSLPSYIITGRRPCSKKTKGSQDISAKRAIRRAYFLKLRVW